MLLKSDTMYIDKSKGFHNPFLHAPKFSVYTYTELKPFPLSSSGRAKKKKNPHKVQIKTKPELNNSFARRDYMLVNPRGLAAVRFRFSFARHRKRGKV